MVSMQDITGELKRADCEKCGTSSSSMWNDNEHQIILICNR